MRSRRGRKPRAALRRLRAAGPALPVQPNGRLGADAAEGGRPAGGARSGWASAASASGASARAAASSRRKLSAGHTWVMDRWYAQFTLWNDVKAAGSSYVCRVRDNSVYDVLHESALDEAALDAGVISDQVEIGLSKMPGERADHPTRLVCLRCTPHSRR